MVVPPPDLNLIQKAQTSEALDLISRQDTVLTYLGPTTILLLFFGTIVLLTLTLGWYLSNEVTETWLLFETVVGCLITLLLFALYYSVVTNSGKFVLSHIRT